MEGGESLIGAESGVVKARDFRRKPENGARWSTEDFDKFVGTPWEPYPGAGGGFEIKSKVRLPTETERIMETIKGKEDYAPRRLRIKKEDLEKYGYTVGCPGCRAANRGATAVGHTEACRTRIIDALEKVGDQRTEMEQERLLEYLEEEENKRKKAKRGESDQRGSQPSGSQPSSSGGVAGQEVPRSRGGVPLEQAPTKRKAEEEDQERAEKKSKGEEDERGVKRSIDEWEDFAKRLKANAETRAEQNRELGSNMDVNYTDMIKEISPMMYCESDTKFNEMTVMMTEQLYEDQSEEYYDAISGEQLDREMSNKAREVEMETYKKHGVYEKAPVEECWRVTGRAP